MKLVHLCCLVLGLYSGVVHSWGSYSYRGGTISFKPSRNHYVVEINYRMSFDSRIVSCGNASRGNFVRWSRYNSPWSVKSYSYYGYSKYKSIYRSNLMLCSDYSSEENWSEGKNTFFHYVSHSDESLIVQTYNYAYWSRANISTRGGGYGSMMLRAVVNTTNTGVFNNSSPNSSLPLTVNLIKGTPSIIRIPVDDPDGDIVRCRKASNEECYRGLCTYFPYGVLDERSCTLSYNGGGNIGQLFPIILKLEDFPQGTTYFDSSNSLGSVDLQFIVHIKRNPYEASVRLQGVGSSGRLQVLRNGVWGTVCDDGWSMTNTHVVCRQLGFAGGLYHRSSGGASGQIWLDEVRCSGSEIAIQQCRHNGWGRHDCSHSEDMYISCYSDECKGYTILSSSNRSQGYRGATDKCDRNDLFAGWYRFMGDAGTAMPTSCVPIRHCGTAAPGWMQGSHPTQSEGVVSRRACFHWNNYCCNYSRTIRVKDCGGFYVYELVRPLQCNVRYCGNNTESNNTCVSSPCRNGGTCMDTDYGYNCSCPYEYTGRQCEKKLNQCYSSPCRNGGTCRGYYHSYYCSCPNGYSGRQCETNIKVHITCGENYMQIDLKNSYFSDIDWRNLHLRDPFCRATRRFHGTRLRTPLDRCGTTYTEDQKTIVFWNEVRTDNRFRQVRNGSNISRERNIIMPFFCSYERRRFVSTSYSPSKKTVVASEGSYGNFTFTMDLYRTSSYFIPYSIFDYPVIVYPNQPLWVQFEVKNTTADLVVFAENCRATTSTNPNSYPQHVFLENGCVRDRTMVYWYNPYSRVQRFSIRSFRFVYSNTFLVYLHCELLVCHRNSTNSRCSRGCISSRRRRETADMDRSELYDLSAGPLRGGKLNAYGNNQEGSMKSKKLIGGLGAFGGLFFLITILLSAMVYRNRRRGQDSKPTNIALDVTVNSYEQSDVDGDEKSDTYL